MPSVTTTSLILTENMRVTRSMSRLAAQGSGKHARYCLKRNLTLDGPSRSNRSSSSVQ